MCRQRNTENTIPPPLTINLSLCRPPPCRCAAAPDGTPLVLTVATMQRNALAHVMYQHSPIAEDGVTVIDTGMVDRWAMSGQPFHVLYNEAASQHEALSNQKRREKEEENREEWHESDDVGVHMWKSKNAGAALLYDALLGSVRPPAEPPPASGQQQSEHGSEYGEDDAEAMPDDARARKSKKKRTHALITEELSQKPSLDAAILVILQGSHCGNSGRCAHSIILRPSDGYNVGEAAVDMLADRLHMHSKGATHMGKELHAAYSRARRIVDVPVSQRQRFRNAAACRAREITAKLPNALPEHVAAAAADKAAAETTNAPEHLISEVQFLHFQVRCRAVCENCYLRWFGCHYDKDSLPGQSWARTSIQRRKREVRRELSYMSPLIKRGNGAGGADEIALEFGTTMRREIANAWLKLHAMRTGEMMPMVESLGGAASQCAIEWRLPPQTVVDVHNEYSRDVLQSTMNDLPLLGYSAFLRLWQESFDLKNIVISRVKGGGVCHLRRMCGVRQSTPSRTSGRLFVCAVACTCSRCGLSVSSTTRGERRPCRTRTTCSLSSLTAWIRTRPASSTPPTAETVTAWTRWEG